MNRCRDYLCVFPDDGEATLDAVLTAMPDDIIGELSHSSFPYFRLTLMSEGAAISLVLGVAGVIQVEGLAEEAEVLVPWSSREMCEQQIVMLNHGPALWTRLERIEASRTAWHAFQAQWLSLTAQTAETPFQSEFE